MQEFQAKVDAKKKDNDILDDRMKQLYGTFDEMIPKEHKFYNYLLRVLNKKIKRKKRVEGEEDGMQKNVCLTFLSNFLSLHRCR